MTTLPGGSGTSPFSSNSSTAPQTSLPSTNTSEQSQEIQSEHSHSAQVHQGANIPLNTSNSSTPFGSQSTSNQPSNAGNFLDPQSMRSDGPNFQSFRSRSERVTRQIQEY